MPKLPVAKSKEVISKLKNLGFVQDHITGSHVILYHPITKRRAVVPFHQKDIKKGTLSSILRESQISKEEFLKA
jgi:mRNA interferase HicA